ncbi:MAG: imidazolonepropionase [Bacteroidetes bacterium]|nr:imidazolonepropionase [Bacteroidota bacterium]HET6245033.1 imidazolonepropionase [Bacteroidia bacterium]
MNLLIKNIKALLQTETIFREKICGKDMSVLNKIEDAWIYIEEDTIIGFGEMKNCPDSYNEQANIKIIDATGKIVLPCWCDSHTHIVYAGSREREFVDRINGLSYEEIAKKGGGILNSAKRLQQTSEEDLLKQALERTNEIMMMGTGAVEIKSGYGLTVQDEIKMLRVIKKLKTISPLEIKSTFLGAHAMPVEYKNNRSEYIRQITDEMLPLIAEEKLADYCDVFCDRGFFTPEETEIILKAGWKYGLQPKIHANELDYSGGIQVGVNNKALSVDHLEFTGDAEIFALKDTVTMPTLLPSTAFFLGLHYPPARKMIDAGLPVALASDYNPGSSPSGKMSFILSLACIKMKMTPEEAINAATLNSAYAMGINKEYGSIAIGKKANLIITSKISSYVYIPYAFGANHIETVIIKGEIMSKN